MWRTAGGIIRYRPCRGLGRSLQQPLALTRTGGSRIGAFSTESPEPEISKRKQFKQVQVEGEIRER